MYAIIALVLVAAFVLATVGLPLRLEQLYEHVRPRVARSVAWASTQAVLPSTDEMRRETMSLTRCWLVLSAFFFTLLGIADGTLVQNRPEALRTILGYGSLACFFSAVIVSLIVAYKRLASGRGIETTLRRCGFRGLWILDASRQPRRLAKHIATQGETCSRIRILEVMGHGMLVKRSNAVGRSIRGVLESRTDIPVQILLLDPMTRTLDPDRRHATVFQTTCAEMRTQSCPYMRHLRETLGAIAELNESRAPEAQITVQFYGEKPTFRAVLFDDSMIVLPWQASARTQEISCVRVERESEAPSFYETFRREFSRLWQQSITQVFTA